jgi:hypothetical protein
VILNNCTVYCQILAYNAKDIHISFSVRNKLWFENVLFNLADLIFKLLASLYTNKKRMPSVEVMPVCVVVSLSTLLHNSKFLVMLIHNEG